MTWWGSATTCWCSRPSISLLLTAAVLITLSIVGVMYDLVGFSYNLLVLQALCIIVIILNCLAWVFPAKPAPSITTLPADRY
jgi:hypothetical protein